MKKILLTQNKFALVDNADFYQISRYKWSYNNGYAVRASRVSDSNYKKGGLIMMHRQITGFPVGKEIDHINGNRSDNRRCNLRVCTHAENIRNQKIKESRFKGIHQTQSGSWQVLIWIVSKNKHIGTFATQELAAKAYDVAARKYFGEFARLNFPEN